MMAESRPRKATANIAEREQCRPKVNTSLRGPEFCNHEEENFVTTGRNAKLLDSGQAAIGAS